MENIALLMGIRHPEMVRKLVVESAMYRRDGLVPGFWASMFRLLPHGRLAVLRGTDHMSIVKRADWQVSMILEFLDAPMPNAR